MKKLLLFGLMFLVLITCVSARINITQNILDEDFTALDDGPDGNRNGLMLNFSNGNYTNITISYKEYALAGTPTNNFTLYLCPAYLNKTPDERAGKCNRTINSILGSQAMTNGRWYNFSFPNAIMYEKTDYIIIENQENTQLSSQRQYRMIYASRSSAQTYRRVFRVSTNATNWGTPTEWVHNFILYGDVYTPPVAPNPSPVFTSLGVNTTTNNYTSSINFTCTNNQHYLWFSYNNISVVNLVVNNKTEGNYSLTATVLTQDGNYYYKASCGFENTTVYRFTFDSTRPIFTMNINSVIQSNNGTIIYNRNALQLINFSLSDERDLFAVEVIIYNATGAVKWNFTNITLTGNKGFNFSNTSNFTALQRGIYWFNGTVSDTHTNNNEFVDRDYLTITNRRNLTFITHQENELTLMSNANVLNWTVNTLQDRKNIKIIYESAVGDKIITFLCNNSLYLINNTKYNVSEICYNPITKKGNWIDYENNMSIIPNITKLVVAKYGTVYLFNFGAIKSIEFNSIGGLNYGYGNFQFEVVDTQNGFCRQWNDVINFTGTMIVNNLTVECFNYGNLQAQAVIIQPPSGYGNVNQTINITSLSSNRVNFTNISARGTADSGMFNIPSVIISKGMNTSTNLIRTFIPIDPPYAFTKDGVVDCAKNDLITKDVTIPYNITTINTGTWKINATVTAKSIFKKQDCTFIFYPIYGHYIRN